MSATGLFYHQKVPAPIRIATAIGITTAAFAAGQTLSLSYLSAPALLEAPAPLLVKQWKQIFFRARPTAAVPVVVSGLFAFLAYRELPGSSSFMYYATSAALLASTVPYTILLLGPLNKQMQEKSENLAKTAITDTAAEAGVAKEETVHGLVDRWATLNLGRGLLAATSSVLALWASLEAVEVHGFTLDQLGFRSGANRLG